MISISHALCFCHALQFERAKQKKQEQQQQAANRPQRKAALLAALQAQLAAAADAQLLAKVHALTAAAAEAAGISAATAAQQENIQPEGTELDSAAAAAADANGQCSDDQHAGHVSGFVNAQQQAALDASTTAAAAVQLLREDHTQQQQQQQQQQGEEAGEALSSHLPYQPEHYPHQQQQQHLQDALQEQGVSSRDTAHAAPAAGEADGAWTKAADDAAWAEPLATAHSAALSDLPISRESSAVSAAADDHDHHQQQQREWVPWAEFVEVREKLRSKLDRGKVQFEELKGLHRKGKADARGLREEVSCVACRFVLFLSYICARDNAHRTTLLVCLVMSACCPAIEINVTRQLEQCQRQAATPGSCAARV
jgi:hypothetical protein